jgi:cell division protein FtsB
LSIFRNLSKLNKAKGKVAKVEQNIEKLIRENKELEERLKEVQSTQFVEKEIRDKLGLAKEGEIVVVLPDEEILRKLAPKIEEEETELPDPNWKKWIKLFL